MCICIPNKKKCSFSGDLQLSLGPRSRKLLLKRNMFSKSSLIIENQAYIGFLLITMKKLFLKKKSHFTKKGLSLNTHLVLIGVSFSSVSKDFMDFAKKSATILSATSLPRDSLWKNSHEKTNYRETSSESPLPDKNSNTQIQTQIQVQIQIQVQ